MKTNKLTMVAMGLMAGLLMGGSVMAQGGYYYDGGWDGGGQVIVNRGCGNPNCRNPNCGGGGGGWNGGGQMGGYSSGQQMYQNNRYSGGNQFQGNSGGRRMEGGTAWQLEQERLRREQMRVQFQDPGLAVVGGILGGIGGALNKDPAKNGAAGEILNGIGGAFILGAQPQVDYNRQDLYREQGQMNFWIK